ncbi:hypothetical protein PNOK_0214100 [Pyrrhoderma noxium]|uniref:Uncharacterized protein n=1 Tax=Pyrrhoderma noxium TaxID=2282107 RepID=A0A286URN1_9AGAM|nr:hypothetical protein PNOK_0214100 [Pyrrhoderma noxium]
MSESIESLESSTEASDDGYSSDEELRLAQLEWEENLQQLQLLISVVLMPYIGKWLGRKWAHTIYARYTRLGFTKAFFLGERFS